MLALVVPFAQGAVFQTSFDWKTPMKQIGSGCGAGFAGAQPGVTNNGAWRTGNTCDETTPAANLDGVGFGFRHWRGNGENSGGGGIRLTWPMQTRMWVTYLVRYAAGFRWGGTINAKDIYVAHTGDGRGTFYWGFHEGRLGGHVESEGGNRHTSVTWAQYNNGSSVSDGRVRCWEVFVSQNTNAQANGTIEAYLDGQQLARWTDVKFARNGSAQWGELLLGENQNAPSNPAPQPTDYDRVSISATRVGCPGTSVVSPPP
jgi:hypothetical protein